MPLRVELVNVEPLGSFPYRWPHVVETFDRGWDIVAGVDGETVQARHGLGEREVYGRRRVHSVTFLRGKPVVEGVAADDHASSGALLSLIEGPDRRLVRRAEDLPCGYEGLHVVDHASEIQAPSTRRGLAVKVREDDLETWVVLAVLRTRTRRAAGAPRRAAGTTRRASPGRGSPRQAAHAETDRALEELRDGLRLADLASYLRAYEEVTGDDRALDALRAEVGGSLDPEDPAHRDALIRWLRRWGCRHLRLADHEQTSAQLLDWWRECGLRVPPAERELVDLEDGELAAAGEAFDQLGRRPAAGRRTPRGAGPVTFGPTAAAKTLFAVRPRALVPWDTPIRKGLGRGDGADAYRRYLAACGEALQGFAARVRIPVDGLPHRLGRPRSTPAKLVDEYLWIRVTRGWRPPAGPRGDRP